MFSFYPAPLLTESMGGTGVTPPDPLSSLPQLDLKKADAGGGEGGAHAHLLLSWSFSELQFPGAQHCVSRRNHSCPAFQPRAPKLKLSAGWGSWVVACPGQQRGQWEHKK